MIQVFLNSRKLDDPLPDLDQLPQLLAAVEDRHLSEDTFISDVLLDGESLVADGVLDLKKVSLERREAAARLTVLSSTLYEVTRDAIRGAQSYIGDLEKPVSLIALQFNAGQFEKAHSNLRVLLEGISSLISLANGLEARYSVDWGELTTRGAPVRTHMSQLRDLLRQFVKAQEQQDTIMLADLLEYELKPALGVWNDIFTACWDHVEERQQGSANPDAMSGS